MNKLNTFTVRARVTKGSAALGVSSGGFVDLLFAELPGYGVRVTGAGPTLWMAGSRKYLPPVAGGEQYNLHAGDPTRYVTISIK